MSSSEGNGKPGLGSWNGIRRREPDNSLYRVWEAAIAAVYNCLVRAHSTLTLPVLLGMWLGYVGVFKCVFMIVIGALEIQDQEVLHAALSCAEIRLQGSGFALIEWNLLSVVSVELTVKPH